MDEIEIVKVKANINQLLNEVNLGNIMTLKKEINDNFYYLREFPSFENFKTDFLDKLSSNLKKISVTSANFSFIELGTTDKYYKQIYTTFKENRLFKYKLEDFTAPRSIKEKIRPTDKMDFTVYDSKASPTGVRFFSFNIFLYYTQKKNEFTFVPMDYFKDVFKKQAGGAFNEKEMYKFNIIVTDLIIPLPSSPLSPLSLPLPPSPMTTSSIGGSNKYTRSKSKLSETSYYS